MHLLRATELIGRPVVTLGGESDLEVKDVVFSIISGRILGFTLRKPGLLGGPVDQHLPWTEVHGLGPDAVMVPGPDALGTGDELLADGDDVIGDRVMTESGTDLGEVLEVVVATGRRAEVVGFEIEPSAVVRSDHAANAFIPLPDTLSISGENVIVPDSTTDYIGDDLAGFGSAVTEFRSRLREEVV
jgi:uncharacterized protein YrrD